MDLICTFVQVMKKVVLFLFIVLLVLFMPTYSYALDHIPSHDYGAVKYNQLYISNNMRGETPYFDAVFLEEDQDDASTSEKEKFSPEKNTFTIGFFVPANFSDDFFKKITFTNNFLNCSQPGFIYLRVLRL
jgi:hypothetical protein